MGPVAKALKSGGIVITSGILEGKEPSVAAAMQEAGLEIMDETHQGEWACLSARKK